MLLSYLLALGILAYIVYLFARSYDNLAREVREMRVKCMGGGGAGQASEAARVVAKTRGQASAGAAGVVSGAAASLAGRLQAASRSFG